MVGDSFKQKCLKRKALNSFSRIAPATMTTKTLIIKCKFYSSKLLNYFYNCETAKF